MVVSAVVAGGTQIGSSIIQSNAAKKAASEQAAAENNATQTQQNMFNQTQANTQPFIQQGQAANSLLENELPSLSSPVVMNEAALQQTPGYQFNLTQGLKAAQNSAAARGLGVSGAAFKGAENYATGLADNTYQNQFNNALQNKQNTYNELTGATQIGANAAAGLGQTSAQVGSNIASNIVGAGNAEAQGTLGSANAISSGLNGLQNAFYANKILGGSNGSNSGIYDSSASNFYNPSTFDSVAYQSGLPWSDVRLKENVKPRGEENGYPVYEFNYKGNPKKYIGVMAQEILDLTPQAVSKLGKYFAVNYELLGVKFREVI